MLKVIGGAQEGEFKATASGTLPNGKPVVVNSDGTVSSVSSTGGVGTLFGSSVQLSSDKANSEGSWTYDSVAEKVVLVYSDRANSFYGTALVGTVSGNSISFGTAVIFHSAATGSVSCVYDPDTDQIVVCYVDDADSDKGKAVVGSVSGTSISFGSEVQFSADEVSNAMDVVYDTVNDKIFVLYTTSGPSVTSNTDGNVGTVSTNTISFGSVQRLSTDREDKVIMHYDTNSSKILITVRTSAGALEALTAEISGTSVTYNSAVTIASDGPSSQYGMAYDETSQRLLVGYSDGTTDYLNVNVLEVDGTSFNVGPQNTIVSSSVSDVGMGYDPTNGSVTTLYQDVSDSQFGKGVAGTVSGTTYTVSSPVTFESARMDRPVLVADVGQERLVAAYDGNSESTYEAIVIQTVGENLTAENYIGMSSGPASPSGFGTAAVFETGATDDIGSAYDSTNNRHVIAYQDEGNSNYGTAVVATVSGNTVSFGTPVVFETGTTKYVRPVFDSTTNKVVIFYQDDSNSGYLTAIVGTVSGTSISFGTAVVADSNSASWISAAFDSANGKVVCHYETNNGYGIVGTVSGTSISFGTRVEINGGTTQYIDSVYDSNAGKVVATYRDNADSNNGNARVGTVSGTSISYGTEATFNSGNTEWRCSVFDPTTNKIAIFYKDAADSDKGKIVVGTVSGTSISFGSEVEVTSGAMFTTNGAIAVDSNGKLAMVYRDLGNSSYGTLRTGTISGTTVTLDDAQVYSEVNSQHNVITYNSVEDRMLVAYSDVGGNDQGIGQVYNVGFAGEVADGNAATIDIIGSVSTNQGNLTAGEKYYVQTDGTLSTTADDPSVLAGTAISATKLVVKT